MPPLHLAYLSFGSNLGDREAHIHVALNALQNHPGMEVRKTSTFWETVPIGGPPGQSPFLNGAVEIATQLSPQELMQVLLQIEQQQGRLRMEKFGPRTLD